VSRCRRSSFPRARLMEKPTAGPGAGPARAAPCIPLLRSPSEAQAREGCRQAPSGGQWTKSGYILPSKQGAEHVQCLPGSVYGYAALVCPEKPQREQVSYVVKMVVRQQDSPDVALLLEG